MNANWTLTPQQRQKYKRRRLLSVAMVVVVLIFLATYLLQPATSQPPSPRIATTPEKVHNLEPLEINLAVAVDEEPSESTVPEPLPDNTVSHSIVEGDTLSSIFDMLGIHSVMYQILAADESLLALDVLRPGQKLTFTFDREAESTLLQMELFVHPAKQVVYSRFDAANFGYEEIIHPGRWEQEVIEGEIHGSFYLTAKQAGLSETETVSIGDLFGEVINFAREIRAGDRFQVVRSRQFVGDEYTGQSRIEGVRLQRGQRDYTAFLFEDGNYYDATGESLARAFRRYPMGGKYRVSSHFNPKRKHPITRQVRPHNGVDFAMPTGTSILAIGDGVVTRTVNHPYAGKYVEIQYGSNYLSRYLHLDRILVRRGQTVKRGDRVALSGNTGLSTGPHLHYELHIKGRPVNPLKAKIPMATSVAKDKRSQFEERARALVAVMENGAPRVASHQTQKQP